MKSTNTKTSRLMCTLAIASLCGLPLLLTGCEKTESKTSSESKKVVDTPEGKKTVTEKSETKTTTEKK